MPVRTVAVGPRFGGGGGSGGPFVARAMIPGVLNPGQDVLENRYSFAAGARLSRWHIQAKSSAPAQNVVIDVLVSTDGGQTWASIFPEGGRITLPAGYTEAEGSNFAVTSFSRDHKLRVDVLNASGADYEFYLSGSWA